jgi:hypothetical protein
MTYADDSWKDSYDAWKLATPPEYDGPDEPECFCEDYEINWEGRATCDRCGHEWWPTPAELEAERQRCAIAAEMLAREERREFWRRLTYPIRWPLFRLLERVWPRKACSVLVDDEIPF